MVSHMTLVCENIGPRQRRRRLSFGIVMLGIAVTAIAVLAFYDVARPWRILVAAPVFLGLLGVLQARARTCVALAARGLRNMDDGTETVIDPAEISALKGRARRINAQAAALTVLVVGLFLFYP